MLKKYVVFTNKTENVDKIEIFTRIGTLDMVTNYCKIVNNT